MTLSVAPEPNLLPALPAQQAWSSLALCKGKTDIFFGPPGERPSKRRKRETLARSYCKVCPVAEPCREAGRVGRENGVWGDENEEERARAGWTPIATERRAVARAAREAREAQEAERAHDTMLSHEALPSTEALLSSSKFHRDRDEDHPEDLAHSA